VPAPAQGYHDPADHNQHQQDAPRHAPNDGRGHRPGAPPMLGRRRGVGEFWVRKRDGGDSVSVCSSGVSRMGSREAGEGKARKWAQSLGRDIHTLGLSNSCSRDPSVFHPPEAQPCGSVGRQNETGKRRKAENSIHSTRSCHPDSPWRWWLSSSAPFTGRDN
jgi:hypothetical protein